MTFLRADILAKLCRCFYIQFQIGISHLKHPNCNAVNNKLLLFYGDTFYVEKMNYKALQKRSAETEIDAKTGKIHSKKRFGKSLGRCAPAMFISMLTQKAERYNGKVIKVDTFKTKASQFDHTDDSFTKKKLSQRFAKLSDGTVVQRDLYSAFLLAHLDDKHETLDHFFDVVVDGNCIQHSKPDPEVFLTAAERLHVAPVDCLVVEDAISGAEAGHAGGMKVACVGDASKKGAGDYNMHSFEDLLTVLA